MRRKDLSPEEVRVLGCLVEKQRTTPGSYPLTLNSLRLACNQSTNRDPVLDLDEAAVRAAAERLARNGLARFTSKRVAKYRHVLELPPDELAALSVLMLRGPQTPGEVKQRGDVTEIHETLDSLISQELIERLDRQPGQKEQRYRHLLSEQNEEEEEEEAETPEPSAQSPTPNAQRLADLEAAVRALRAEIEDLKRSLS